MNYLIARVSDPKQLDALPAQRQKLFDYAEKRNWIEKKDFIYTEFDETAFKNTRKKFNENVMKPLLAAKDLSIIVFDKIDRFSRDSSSEEKSTLTKLFRAGKIELHFPSDNLFIHKNSPAADLFRLDIGVALAGYYSSAIRDNVKRRIDQKLHDGEWPGKAPIGFVNYVKGEDSKGEPIRDIMPDPERAHHILEGFKLRSNGMSYGAIAKDRKQAGLVSNTKLLKPITKGQWEEMINNPFYYGEMRYVNKLYPHKYEPIVPVWLWEKCQQVKKMRSTARTQYNNKPFLFRNLKCSKCGFSISFDGPKKNGQVYGKCTEYGGKHGATWVDERVLVNQVIELLKSIQVPKKLLPQLQAEVERRFDNEQESYKDNKARLLNELKVQDDEVKRLFKERGKFNLRPELFEELVKDTEVKQKAILQELEDHGNGNRAFVIGAQYILELASNAVELFTDERTKLEQKRYLLNFIVATTTFDGEKLVFNLKEPFKALLNSKNKNLWLPTIEEVITVIKQDLIGLQYSLAS